MCFFDQTQFSCGDFKWGQFRQHCAKEYRTGETCGMKLVMNTLPIQVKCKICRDIDTKMGCIKKEQERVYRWKTENGITRQHSIEAAEVKIRELQSRVAGLFEKRAIEMRAL